MPVYALMVAKNGHKLKENPTGQTFMRISGGSNGIELTATAGSIALLVNQLSNVNGRRSSRSGHNRSSRQLRLQTDVDSKHRRSRQRFRNSLHLYRATRTTRASSGAAKG